MPDASVSNEKIHFTVRALLGDRVLKDGAIQPCKSLHNATPLLTIDTCIWRLPGIAGSNITYDVREDEASDIEINLLQRVMGDKQHWLEETSRVPDNESPEATVSPPRW